MLRLAVAVCLGLLLAGATSARAAEAIPAPGKEFRDCDVCPPMVAVPQGSFMMGSPPAERNRSANEGPAYRVTIGYPLAMAKHEVTFAEWDACVAEKGCRARSDEEGPGREKRPATGVSWYDVEEYVAWLSKKTGKRYRVPSGAEWEYAARGGKATPYWWGQSASHEYANYGKDKCCDGHMQGRDKWLKVAPVESFPANPYGLHDMLGNVWEWVDDCAQETYADAPADGSSNRTGDCNARAHRGGSWGSLPERIRAAFHQPVSLTDRGVGFIGFRVARGE